MTKINLALFFFLLFSTKLWAFPSIFEFVEDNTKMIVSCVEGVEPIAEVGDIQRIASHLDCDAQPIEKYCECINTQYPEKLDEVEISILEMELGFFGKDDDTEMLDMLERMMRLQQVLSSYDNITNGQRSCFKGNATVSGKDIDLSLETVLNQIENSGKVPLPYYKSSYVDMAKDLQRSVQAGERINFDNEGKGDAKFLIQLASTIANSKSELLTDSFTPTPDFLQSNGLFNQEAIGANEIVSWQDSVKAMIKNKERGAFDGSPLFQSLKDTFNREEKGEYIPNKDAFFDNLVSSVRALGLDKKDVENLKAGKKPSEELIRKRMGSPVFSDAISRVAETMCLNLSQEFLWDAKTEDTKNGLMSIERIRKNASKGRELIKEFSVLDPSKKEDRPKLREMIRVRNNMFEKMVSQFDHYREGHPSKKNDEKIRKYIDTKKISMGKLWCTERKTQEELGAFETTVHKVNEVAPEAVDTLNTVQGLRDQLLKHELEGTQINEEIGVIKRKIQRYEDEISHSRTQLILAEKRLQEAKNDTGTTDSELNALQGRVNGFRRNLSLYPPLIRKEEAKKTKLAGLLGESRRAQRMYKRKIREAVDEAVDDSNGWFDNWATRTANQDSGPASGLGSGDATQDSGMGTGRPATGANMDEATKRRIFSDYRVASPSQPGQSGGVGNATHIVQRSHGDEKTVSYDTDSDQYVIKSNRDEALDQGRVVTRVMNVVRESTEQGVRDGTEEDVLEAASSTMATLANDVSNSFDLNDVGEAEILNFKESIAKFDSDMSPVLGEMNFTALNEFEPAQSVDEIADSHLAKQLGSIKTQGRDVAASLAGISNDVLQPNVPLDSSNTPGSGQGFINPEVTKDGSKEKLETSPLGKKSSLSKGSIKPKTAEQLAQSIFNSRKNNKAENLPNEEELDVKVADPEKAAEIKRLKREIEQEKKASEKLDREILESKEKRESLTSNAIEKVKKKDRIVATPGLKPSVTPTPANSSSGTGGNSGRKIASISSGSVGSAASSSNNISAVVDGRVKGGVIVNGEFIPQALLSNKVVNSVKEVPNSDLILSSNSTFDMEPISSESKMAGIPVVKSDKFSKLTPEEKEVFIQKQLVRLKAEQILIEVQDGTNLLVKSTVKLRTRIKVSGLNKLLEKANE